jgi:hypothetical protein
MTSVVIEYPAQGSTYHHDAYGVYAYGVYPRGSVLEGQERRSNLGTFDTLTEAQAAFPDADYYGEGGTGFVDREIPVSAPEWFDPADAGESWDEDY